MSAPLTTNELAEAVVSYLAVVIKNDAVKAVAEAEGWDIGGEIAEHFERGHGSLADVDHRRRYQQLINMGDTVIQLCAEIAIRTRVTV